MYPDWFDLFHSIHLGHDLSADSNILQPLSFRDPLNGRAERADTRDAKALVRYTQHATAEQIVGDELRVSDRNTLYSTSPRLPLGRWSHYSVP